MSQSDQSCPQYPASKGLIISGDLAGRETGRSTTSQLDLPSAPVSIDGAVGATHTLSVASVPQAEVAGRPTEETAGVMASSSCLSAEATGDLAEHQAETSEFCSGVTHQSAESLDESLDRMQTETQEPSQGGNDMQELSASMENLDLLGEDTGKEADFKLVKSKQEKKKEAED